MSVSRVFSVFMEEAPAQAQAWFQTVKALDAASALDKKTGELAYLAVLAASGHVSGVPFHVLSAKSAGASRQEILSAILVGLPAVGVTVLSSLPVALAAFDGQNPNGGAD
jgi:alkylhydroperoxidase/carboxymuconolactone decarboxylase family protein YurZ